MTKYKLYMTRMTDEALAAFENEPFVRATSQYILVYTEEIGEHPFPAAEITGEMAEARLTEAETKWLLSCNIAIINSELVKNAPKVMEGLSAKIDALENALENERTKLEEGATVADADE